MTNLITAIKNVLHPNINVALCKIWEITCCKRSSKTLRILESLLPLLVIMKNYARGHGLMNTVYVWL